MIRLLHPADGQLRRIVDEPLLVPDRIKVHVQSCVRCSARLEGFRAEVADIRRLMSPSPELELDTGAALAAVQSLAGTSRPLARIPIRDRLPRQLAHPGRGAGALAAIAVLGVTGVATAVAGVQWTQIFAPTTVESVPVSGSALLSLPHLSEFGQLTHAPDLMLRPESSLGAAETAAGVTVSLPAVLPQGVSGSPSYYLVEDWSATFAFSAARALAAAQAAGVVLPALPAGFDGTELRESIGPGVLVVYGTAGGSQPLSLSDLFGTSFGKQHVKCSAPGATACTTPPRPTRTTSLPTLALMAVQAPVLDSTGVTISQLEKYLLSLPFLPSSLATAINQLGNPLTTLPIPDLPGLGQSQPTTVNGDKGVLFASDSPILSAVVWEHQGTVRAVGGLLGAASVLKLARG
ncbi:MAG: hypothetical protein WBF51_07640 [Candidatus Dormiibacterota bacterium]